MSRKPRIEYPGAFYHVIVRGNQKQRIFKDETDRQKYLLLLTAYKNRTGSRIYAYILMHNHVHLLLEARDTPLSRVMQGLNQTYTMYYNRKYRTVGHLFQGRYKAILCDRDAYLLGLLKYIHRNPLRAKIAERLDAYPWSSHHAYTGNDNPLGIVDTDQVLRMFSESRTRARRKYREFMADRDTLDRRSVYATIDQRLQGDEQFLDEVQKLTEQQVERERKRKEHSLEQISGVVAGETGVGLPEMRSETRRRIVADARRMVSIMAVACGYRKAEIARFLRKDPAAVTQYVRDAEGRKEETEKLLRMLEKRA